MKKKLRRQFSKIASDSDSDDSEDSNDSDDVDDTTDGMDGMTLNEQDNMPSEGYYWPGKDYANTYKADFKDLNDFSSGLI